MTTTTATGSSKSKDSRAAAEEAVRRAVRQLDGAKPSFGFLFVSPKRDLRAALRAAREAAQGADFLGCTTAGEITEMGLTHDGLAVLLVASDNPAAMAFSQGLKARPGRVGDELTAGLDQLRKAAGPGRRKHLTTVLLTDGLAGTGEKLVADLYERTSHAQIVGGAAGDEGNFLRTYVGAGAQADSDAAGVVHVLSQSPWGLGVNHGLRPTTRPMRVTKAIDNVVYELDGEPAFSVYKRHAASRGTELTPQTAGPYLIANELGIHFFDRIARARAPLSAGADGSLTCAAEIPKGSMVSILDGEPTTMVAAARNAAEEANERLEGAEAAGVLLFDCVCRGMILKDEFDREVEAVRGVFGDVPIAGFLTYGEIARSPEKLDGWHNTTAVVVAIPK